IFEEAWETLWKDAFLYLIAGLLSALLVGISLGVLGGVVWVGFALLIERRKQGHDVGPVAMFSGFGHFIPATLAFAILVVGVSVGLVLLVLPGLFLFAAWSLTFCAMARE